ncbi:MAG TPA: thioredoxin domain-containing protein, partial [Solirubrobacteraceae bacterium]
GWPLNAFVTPAQVPFYAGTYFPPQPRHGMPSWRQVLEAVAEAWDARRHEIEAGSERIVERLRGAAELEHSSEPLDPRALDAAVDRLRATYDPAHGGFGGAPKFPPASAIELLLARGEREMAIGTLEAMARGGIHDQVGGGFARYAVDATWTVPHFEKMLYDNALLARAYLHGFQTTADGRLAEVCTGTLDWALREMRGPEGGFYSALDADSEGVEGKFYVWTVAELREVLGAELADPAIAYFGASERGNFEGTNVLEAPGPAPARLAEIRERLLQARAQRVRPGLDDKRVTSWNALMIGALCEAGAVLEREDYVDAARACADFVLRELRDDQGRLLRTYNDGRAKLLGYLEDHAFMLEALLTLYESTFEERWFVEARSLADGLIERFGDPQRGGFYSTAADHEQLLARRKELDDAPIPSGSSSAAFGLLRLAALTGEHEYERQAVGALRLAHEPALRHPNAFAHALRAIDFHTAAVREVALVGDDSSELQRVVRERLRPHVVLAGSAGNDSSAVPLLEGRVPVDGRPAAYVCERFACRVPVTAPVQLAALLD